MMKERWEEKEKEPQSVLAYVQAEQGDRKERENNKIKTNYGMLEIDPIVCGISC